MEKIFAVYKPKGPTSHDIIDRLRRITGEQRIGHAGTLDPLASGVLVVGVGRDATRKLGEVVKKEKEYITDIFLGMESATDDAQGPIYHFGNCQNGRLDKSDIEKAVKKFVGKILQVPPIYSAIKVKGKKAYEAARKGDSIELKPREVEIRNIEILKYEWPHLILKVTTGPGVYIRALARDIGRELKTGGYLFNLERTRVGQFAKKEALATNKKLTLF